MRKTYRIKNLFIFAISDEHMFYKYDLTIELYFISILIMWNLTPSGKQKGRTNYLSFSMFTRSYKRIAYFKL
jgi:hypothetical protein